MNPRRRFASVMLVVATGGALLLGPVASAGALGASRAAAPKSQITFGVQPAGAVSQDSRPFLNYGATPGGTLSDHIAVLNYSAVPLSLTVYATDALNSKDGGFGLLLASQKAVDVGSWISLGARVRTVKVPPRTASAAGRVILPLTLRIPVNASPGDHAGGILAVLTTVSTNKQGARVRLEQRVATRVYLRISGPLHPGLAITDLHAHYRGTANPFAEGSAVVSYIVKNTGNVKLAGRQRVDVSGLFGSDGTASGLADLPLLLPGGSVQVSVTVPGVYPELFMTGNVTVTPLRPTGDADPGMSDSTASVHFWAIPWPLLVLLGLLVAGWFAYRRWARRRHRPVGGRPADGQPAGPELAMVGS
jgi:hypothetical protein